MYYQLRENIYEEKKYSLLRNLYLLMSGYTTKTSLTIYKCTENIYTDSEILSIRLTTFAHQSLTSQELLELTTTKRSEKNKRGKRTLIGNADCSFNKVLFHTVTVRFSIPSV